MAPPRDVVGLVVDLETLCECKRVVDPGSDRWSVISYEEAVVIDGDARAQFAIGFAGCLIRSRWKVRLSAASCARGALGAFLDDVEGRRTNAVARYRVAFESTHPLVKTPIRRSTLSAASMRVVALLC